MGNSYGAMKRDLTESDLNSGQQQRNFVNCMKHSCSVDFPSNWINRNDKLLCVKSGERYRVAEKKQRALSVEKIQPNKSKTSRTHGLNLVGTSKIMLNSGMRAAITDCWRGIVEKHNNDYSKIGLDIYGRIFEVCPELRQVFHIPRESQHVSDHIPFHRSGRLLASVIDLCIRNIYKLEAEMGTVLTMYGRRHYHRQKQGFRVSYFPVFQQCTMDFINENISDAQKTDELMKGWQLMLSYINGKLAEGVELERQYEWETRRRSVVN